jgi:hypothetical protein
MSYSEQWTALSARISGIAKAAELYASFLVSNSSDSFGVGKDLGRHCQSILATLKDFRDTFETVLPKEAREALDNFLNSDRAKVIKDQGTREAKASAIFLVSFESEMSYFLSSRQELIRARSERAFLHLQRLLAVDEDVRKKWESAFQKGETACERLGAVHMLWHGIWAFKVNAERARTDLVFNEPVEQTADPRGIEGIVLTEWKVATVANALKRFEEARDQAALYERGALAGAELTGYRYAVAVSQTELPKDKVPEDIDKDGIIYRHVNIAINPKAPSQKVRSK